MQFCRIRVWRRIGIAQHATPSPVTTPQYCYWRRAGNSICYATLETKYLKYFPSSRPGPLWAQHGPSTASMLNLLRATTQSNHMHWARIRPRRALPASALRHRTTTRATARTEMREILPIILSWMCGILYSINLCST